MTVDREALKAVIAHLAAHGPDIMPSEAVSVIEAYLRAITPVGEPVANKLAQAVWGIRLSALEPIPPSPVRVSEDATAIIALVRHMADSIRQGNFADQRLFLLQQLDRLTAALLPAGETEGETR